MQILPAIDLRGGQAVRLRQGDYARETVFGAPAEMAARWANAGAERLHLVDLDGAKAGRPVNLEAIRAILAAVKIPCQLGGGIRDEASITTMLTDLGIDRVIIGTAALKQPDWFAEMARKFPNRLVLGIDARDGMVATEGWLDVSKTPALDLARQFVHLPVAAIVYTNIANDGMMQGIDPATLADLGRMADQGLPVIASGGVTTAKDITALAQVSRAHPNLTAAIVGRALYEGTLTVEAAIEAAK